MDEPSTDREWTVHTLHVLIMTILHERERRDEAVSNERERALRIKEDGDRRALDLASSIQTYKDEQANKHREQINNERGAYATHSELAACIDRLNATIAPLTEFVSGQRGRSSGLSVGWGIVVGAAGIVFGFIGSACVLYATFHK